VQDYAAAAVNAIAAGFDGVEVSTEHGAWWSSCAALATAELPDSVQNCAAAAVHAVAAGRFDGLVTNDSIATAVEQQLQQRKHTVLC
jgi:2,4-dienoyl-CoA reductase-like NADH-dependent reductase (Old Yellow Enzyme family)